MKALPPMALRSFLAMTSGRTVQRMLQSLLFCGLGVSCIAGVQAQSEPPNVDRQVDWQMLNDPDIGLKGTVLTWPADLRRVWSEGLRHSDSQFRREVADSIRKAHLGGMPGLVALRDDLRAVLETAGEHPVTRTAAAAALVELDTRELADFLAGQTLLGPLPLRFVVEPALAKWDHLPSREVWLDRLRGGEANPELRRIAAQSLAQVGEPAAVEPLRNVLFSTHQGADYRLTAARALAVLNPPESLQWSRQLFAAPDSELSLNAQLAVELLAGASSPEAIELLDQYVRFPAPTVAGVAMRRLLDLDPARLLARAAETVNDRDANIREITLSALTDDPTPQSVKLLARGLLDPVPDLRRMARRALLSHAADPKLRQAVIARCQQVMRIDSWRGLEQATIVLTELEQRQIKDRLIELVDHPRPEVQITAAWAIKHLFEPDDAPRLHDMARRVTDEIDSGQAAISRSFVQAHLMEALGVLKHRPAVEDLVRLVPKTAPYLVQSRAAAIWSLGFLLNPKQDAGLIRSLEARLADANSVPMEQPEVRAASAISLGRIGDPASLGELRTWYQTEGPNREVGRSSGWAVMQMTGEQLPEAQPYRQPIRNWSLEPIGEE
jgi:HEAT repeat protein